MIRSNFSSMVLAVCAIGGLVVVYLFQDFDFAHQVGIANRFENFVFNRSLRFILNDLLVISLIYALFRKKKYVFVAFFVQLLGLVFILLPYFLIKYHYPHYNGPLISFLHRLVVNPLLMLVLIPAFYLQKHSSTIQ